MIVAIGPITDVLAKITAFASGEKTVPGVMFDISDEGLKVCYSDNRKYLIEDIDAQIEPSDVRGKVVFDYNKLISIISVCQPSGKIIIKNVQFCFESNNIVRVRAEKMIPQRTSNDEDAEPEMKVFSIFEQSISWVDASSNMKVEILSRTNYSKIFECDNPDIWDATELKTILSKLSVEKGRIVYVSPNNNSAFVANMAYAGSMLIDPEADQLEREDARKKLETGDSTPVIKANKKYKYAFIMSTSVAKSVADIISKLDSSKSELYVHTAENKVCYIFTDDKKFGLAVEMVDANQTHLTVIGRYQVKGYLNYQITMNRDVFANVIHSAMDAGKMDKTVLKFGAFEKNSDEMAIKITSSDTNASVKNDYAVVCSGCIDRDNNITSAELPISLKIISDIIGMLEGDYVAMDVDIDETGAKFIRIADIDIDAKIDIESKIRTKLGLDPTQALSIDKQSEIRNDYLTTRYYTISAK